MTSLPRLLLTLCFLLPLAAQADPTAFVGRWRLDPARSTALDGWHAWDLVISVDGSRVKLGYDMRWGRTQPSVANLLDTAHPVTLPDFFRVEQRHMALYPAKASETTVTASWLDAGRTLRTEAVTPIEISQGQATMRIYSEYRLIEGDRELLLIELHSSRPRPLVYRFTKVTEK